MQILADFLSEKIQSVKSGKSVDDFLFRIKFYIVCINAAVRVLLEKHQRKREWLKGWAEKIYHHGVTESLRFFAVFSL